MNKTKKYFFILLLAELLFSYAPAFAQTQSTTPQAFDYSKAGVSTQIQQYLCAPNFLGGNQAANSTDASLFTCINKLYRFAIVIASVVGVFFIVIAGYVYMAAEGNQESVEKAK